MTTPFGFAPTFGGSACPFGFTSNWNSQGFQSPFGFSPFSKPFGFQPWGVGFQSGPYGWQQPFSGNVPQGFGFGGSTPWNTFNNSWNTPTGFSPYSYGFSPVNFQSNPWMTSSPFFGGQSSQWNWNNPWGWTTSGFPTSSYGFVPQQTQQFAQPTNFFGASTPFGFGGWSGFSPFTTGTFGQGSVPSFGSQFTGGFTGHSSYCPTTKTGYTPNGQTTTPSYGSAPFFGGFTGGFGSPFGYNPFSTQPMPFGYWNTPYNASGYGFSTPTSYPYPSQGEGETTSPMGVSQRDAA